jgi:quinol monooxygenase YgiN
MQTSVTRTNAIVSLSLNVKPDFACRMRVIAHDLAVTSRTQDGCILYLATESAETPGEFLIFSIWRDAAAYEKHRASPYVRALESQIAKEILESPVRRTSWLTSG